MTGILENPPGVGHNKPESEGARKGKSALGALDQEGRFRPRPRRHLRRTRQRAVHPTPRLSLQGITGRAGRISTARSVINPQVAPMSRSRSRPMSRPCPGGLWPEARPSQFRGLLCAGGQGTRRARWPFVPWQAGDALIVENGCVHQHFNDDPTTRALLLVFKAKPLFLFMNMVFQRIVYYPPKP